MPESLNGVIEVETDETFQIEFRSMKEIEFVHTFKDRNVEKAKLNDFRKKEKEVYSVDLCYQEKGSHFITVAVNLQPMWTYRVIVK